MEGKVRTSELENELHAPLELGDIARVWTLVVQAGAELSDRDSLLLQARQSEGISARRTSHAYP